MLKIRHCVLKTLAACCFVGVSPSYSEAQPYKNYQELVEMFKKLDRDDSNNHPCIPKEVFDYIVGEGYEILDFLATGHSGQTYKAKAPNGSYVVLKFTYDKVSEIETQLSGLKKNISYLGDIVIYDSLKNDYKDGIVDFGQNACKILGYKRFENCRYYGCWTCVFLEYIEGVPLEKYVKANKFCTTDVFNWLKDICKSLKLMYSKNFLHRSVGISNVMIREDGSAVLIDYERSYYKDYFEDLLRKNGKLHNDSNIDSFRYGDYYDLNLIYYSFIDMLIEDERYNKNYKRDNKDLEWALFDLCDSNSMENFLKKVDDLCVKFAKFVR